MTAVRPRLSVLMRRPCTHVTRTTRVQLPPVLARVCAPVRGEARASRPCRSLVRAAKEELVDVACTAPVICGRTGSGERLPRTAPVNYGASSVRASPPSAGRAPRTPASLCNALPGEARGLSASLLPPMPLPSTLTSVEEAESGLQGCHSGPWASGCGSASRRPGSSSSRAQSHYTTAPPGGKGRPPLQRSPTSAVASESRSPSPGACAGASVPRPHPRCHNKLEAEPIRSPGRHPIRPPARMAVQVNGSRRSAQRAVPTLSTEPLLPLRVLGDE
ncbi:hypothetical protein NDU88_004950 [Pleurodeles waltl]|uniref:Uncharacterized protein n=1 Tax=Pleurodeles waltl TaxID=8319 RepID=A0AAV7TTF1_PLEWA|nr:hypothetical protein NDU88_004950 [Pleurodeles waltl]